MQLKKNILKISTILFLAASSAYGDFAVEPLKLNINLERGYAMLQIINKNQLQNFSLELKEDTSKKITNDLSFSPASFSLLPDKTQVIRVGTKSGINYADKSYYLSIKTDFTGLVAANKKIGFKIPIFINNDVDSGVGKDTKSIPANAEVTTSNLPPGEGALTQIKITVPVTAIVE